MDTNVIVAAMRSPSGASAFLLKSVRAGKITMMANLALALEYEAMCKRPEHMAASELKLSEVDIFVNAVIALAEPVKSHFLWRPQLRDAGDEMVLEAAVNGRADALVTFNKRDFGAVPAEFGIEVLTPSEAARRLT